MSSTIRVLALLASLIALSSPLRSAHAAGRPLHIVTLADDPLVAYRGGVLDKRGAALAPTAPKGAASGRVRLDTDTPAARAYLAHLDHRQASVLAQAGLGPARALEIRHRYRHVASGFALPLTLQEAERLSRVPGVAAVEPDRRYRMLTDAGPLFIGADQVWTGSVPGIAATRGEGVVVGIVDSGLNFGHPAFAATGGDGYVHVNPRGRYYGQCLQSPGRCNGKLIGIHDFTSEGTRNGADLDGHGSHVAGIAVGNVTTSSLEGIGVSVPLTLSGVAPHASFIVYKACLGPPEDNCPYSGLLSALDQAAADGVDVLNYSIGGEVQDPWAALRTGGTDDGKAFLNLRSAGVVAIAAAGNEGPGASTVSSPANAPWVIAAANASHDRRFVAELSGVQGPGITGDVRYAGQSVTPGLPRAPIVDGADFGSELCSQGSGDTDLPPTGASNPFPNGTFNGQIVVCRRGVQARVAKGYNVKLAGAGGMVLVNQADLGDSVVADAHYLPAVHLGYTAGSDLYAKLARAKTLGGVLTGSISGVERRTDARGDVLSGNSSRGPVRPYDGWLKPEITAPGSNISSAAGTGSGFASLSGTSMSSPHVAGAAALLIAAQPGWSVSQVHSALLTTAIADVLRPDGLTPATPFDAGAGRVFVPSAARAGLHFALDAAAFIAADPLASAQPTTSPPGGRVTSGPAALNLPSIAYSHCFGTCTFTRVVTDNGSGGTWQASLQLPAGASGTVTPGEFTLAPGASRSLEIRLDLSDARLPGTWVNGRVTLSPVSGASVGQTLPIAVYSDIGTLPDALSVAVTADGGYADRTLSGLAPLANPRFVGTELVRLATDTRTVPVDASSDDPFDFTNAGNYFVLVALPTEQLPNFPTGPTPAPPPATLTASVLAELASSTSRDADLYVGVDDNGNSRPDEGETRCRADGASASERCLLDVSYANGLLPSQLWVAVSNVRAGVSGNDVLRLRHAVATRDSGRTDTVKTYGRYGTLLASGPGRVDAGAAFDVRLQWSSSGMLPNETWVGFLGIAVSPESALAGPVPVFLETGASLARTPILLPAYGGLVAVRLAPGTAHEGIAIDVPPTSNSLQVSLGGSGEGDLHAAYTSTQAPPPAIGTAPARGMAQGTSIHPGADESILMPIAAGQSGRWFVTPVNPGITTAELLMNTRVLSTGVSPGRIDGAYFNPDRPGHGVFLSTAGSQWLLIWYTYLEDGTPTWYLAQADAALQGELAWSAPLGRYTWDGTRAQGTPVGRVTLVRTSATRFTFDWLLNGTHGSEPMMRIDGGGCPLQGGVPLPVTGAWYAPATSGYGYNVLAFASTELIVSYLYDADGNPRWQLGQNTPFGSRQFALGQYRGFCPICAYVPVTSTPAGALARDYLGSTDGQVTSSTSWLAPVVGGWQVEDVVQMLSSPVVCQ